MPKAISPSKARKQPLAPRRSRASSVKTGGSSVPATSAAAFDPPYRDATRFLDELQIWVDHLRASPPAGTANRQWMQAVHGLGSAVDRLRDLDQELLAAEALAEAERFRYRELFELAPDGYLATDAHGRITDANHAAAELLDVPGQYVTQKPLLVFVHKEDRSTFLNALVEMRHRQRGEWTIRLVPRRGAESGITIQATIGAVRLGTGVLEGLRWLLRDVTEQRRIENEATTHRAQLQTLAAELSLAEERERRRIAAGIHDNVSQRLAMTKLLLGGLRESVTPEQRGVIKEATIMLDAALDETRSLTFELSPPILYELGLGAAVGSLAEEIQRRHGLLVRVRDRMSVAALPSIEIRVLLFQAIRELLVNVIKHAAARLVVVRLATEASKGEVRLLRVEVIDNGEGFPVVQPAARKGAAGGFGIFNLRTRLAQVGGSFHISAMPGGGTRAIILVPIAQDTSDNALTGTGTLQDTSGGLGGSLEGTAEHEI